MSNKPDADSATAYPPPPPGLTMKQRAHLRSLGHHLDAIVHVGKEGLTEGLFLAIQEALLQHELIKLRLSESMASERHTIAEALAARCGAALVQVLGRTVLLYCRRPDPDPRPHIPLS